MEPQHTEDAERPHAVQHAYMLRIDRKNRCFRSVYPFHLFSFRTAFAAYRRKIAVIDGSGIVSAAEASSIAVGA